MTSTLTPISHTLLRCFVAGMVVVGSMSFFPAFTPAASAQTDEEAAQQAAREIAAARERANDAAEEYFRAESDIELLELERVRLFEELGELRLLVKELRLNVEAIAVNRFAQSGSQGIPLLTDVRDPNDQLRADVFVTIIADSGANTLDDYEAARVQLSAKQDDIDRNEVDLEVKKLDLLKLQADAEAEVERLREIESNRLQDEAVQRALAAQQREEQRQLEELQRRQAEAERRAESAVTPVANNPAPPTDGSTPVDGSVPVDAPVAVPAAATANSGTTSGSFGASGGTAGGRTGGGGSGTNPRFAGDGYVDAIVCPVAGPSAYADTWGAPRSGGRRHLGVDMIAFSGTPLQAVVSGVVSHRSNGLGGITISLMGDNGNRYYYAHLSRYEGLEGRVEVGQVIGYVGDSGNATGVPHLHFEIRPNNGENVNPYPSVRAAIC